MQRNSLTIKLPIPPELYGQRLDVALANMFPEYSRSQLSHWLKEGYITVNGVAHKPKDKIRGKGIVTITLPENLPHNEQLLPEAIPLEIIFEDDHLLIINKPAGLVVHPGAGNPGHTLVNALLHHDPSLQQLPRAGIIHRLDKDTTGLLMAGKTLKAYNTLIRQMRAREIKRHYLALVEGQLISGGILETLYGRHPRNRLKMAVRNQGREAVTEYQIVKKYHDFTLLEVILHTGRTHQIRVHMAHINHPIVGDPLYGGKLRIPKSAAADLAQALSNFKRQALHAYMLTFCHPYTAKMISVKAELPKDFTSLLEILDKSEE
ncbi:23S rRNA pseudouridine(1911/1915/1917) synthase RluD [Legionella londiniensis]|uniref:23S rRNA pseudouridine(1911/1915/1917) synthase RluD n=1 Tax=Legionella londiniensis TaxID=45068 RepID=UPI00399CC8BF